MSAVRTTEEEVKEILAPGNDYRAGKPVRPFINIAHKMVDVIQTSAPDYDLAPMDDKPSTPDAPSTARVVETWLAAWAYKASDQQLATSNAGRSSASFRGQTGKYLEMNNYGQVAQSMLDMAGLGVMTRGTFVGTEWLGKAVADMLTWDDRNWNAV